ncbi:MAG: sugar transferase, partial [Lachnospiraceae bacterium]|nr:sugar transferase [Lachnospiraceae bacterium]
MQIIKNKKAVIRNTLALAGCSFAVLNIIAGIKKGDSVFDNEPEQKNLLEGRKVIFVENENEPENADGARGHLEDAGEAEHKAGFYQKYVKRGVDMALSFAGLLVLGPVIGATALAIKIDDPGPVFFTQKRIGQNKQYFRLHKFRSMKMSTPHDVPTHMLGDPDQYITKVGRFLRAHSLDELPQIWDIFIGNMSVIGPRPALWNQDVLTSEREKYGVNELKPGLTGWAQINGRDELELEEKARLDGEYADRISEGGLKAFIFDCKCFIGTIFSVARSEGVVEGGTGAMRDSLRSGVPANDPATALGCDMEINADRNAAKRVLITGAGSYIGESVKAYAGEHFKNLEVDTIDMIDGSWRNEDFGKYDCVYHVAGLAHADVGNVSDEVKEKYYAVNTDLAIETARKAKAEGVKQFIFMSSMIVYGDSAPYGT